jgi:peptidoglycan-associated lipoprotein
MLRILCGVFGLAVALMLAGCPSTPVKEQPVPVTDGVLSGQTPAQTGKAPVTVKEQPVTPAQIEPPKALTGPAALKDPGNILSKRIISFDFDSNIVKEEFRPLVAAHAKYLAQDPKAKMIIQGHTDERGSREYNLALGQRRSDAVKQMMSVLGADAARVETVSFGEEKPRAQGNSEAAYAENRRAEIVYQTD